MSPPLPEKLRDYAPQCFPYIARRLLTDNNPRTRAALRQLLYAVRACKELPGMTWGNVCARPLYLQPALIAAPRVHPLL